MRLVNMRDMLYHAYQNGYAVGAFDLVSLDFLEGIMDAAERCNAPVILSLAESHFEYFDFELVMPAVVAAARRASVPVAIHHDAMYRYTWLIRFCHSAVIESYRIHPKHVAFADTLFRPVAGERISIDYQT